jgi:putrescine transport system ATP-binding protein
MSDGAAASALIRIEGVTKRFGPFTAVDGLSLDIGRGEFFALLGPSGCGKTTLLRMLAGFETPDAGRILLDGIDITAMPPYRRPLNMMFQSYALFPHLSVAGNIAFGLKRAGMARDEIARRLADMLRLTRLEGLEQRKPHQLSGGQRQRVALARALALRPRVLLLDEPLAALDKKLREETQFELKALQRDLGLTFVIVTHDQDEALSLADRIGVMEKGRLAQVGTPGQVYDRPSTRYVAEFVGDINILEGLVESTREGLFLNAPAGRMAFLADPAPAAGARAALAVRPERLVLLSEGSTSDTVLVGTVLDSTYLGDTSLVRVRAGEGTLLRVALHHAGGQPPPRPGQAVRLGLRRDAGVLLGDAP